MNIYTGIKYHKLPIYPQAVLFCIGEPFEDILKYVKEHISEIDAVHLKVENFSDENRGYTIFLKDSLTILVWIHKNQIDNLGIITHELFHCTEFIMDHCGIIHCDESSEAFAYLLTHLSEQLQK